jgi:hypothetical protein
LLLFFLIEFSMQ